MLADETHGAVGAFLLPVVMPMQRRPERRRQVLQRKRREAKNHPMMTRRHFDGAEQHVGAHDRHVAAVDLGDPTRIVGFVQASTPPISESASISMRSPRHAVMWASPARPSEA